MSTNPQKNKKPMSRAKKILFGILGGIVALIIIAALAGDPEPDTPQAQPTATAQSEAPASSKATEEASKKPKEEPQEKVETEAPEPTDTGQKWADKQYASFLENYGVKSQTELLKQNAASVQSYLVSAESPSSGTVVFTAQLTESDVDKAELKQAAMAVLNLIGYSDDSVDRVEIVTADSLVRGTANRYDSPLLNR